MIDEFMCAGGAPLNLPGAQLWSYSTVDATADWTLVVESKNTFRAYIMDASLILCVSHSETACACITLDVQMTAECIFIKCLSVGNPVAEIEIPRVSPRVMFHHLVYC